VLGACAARAPSPPAPAYDAAVGLATFERAWQIINDTHFDSTFNGVDWKALHDSLLPRARAATSTPALRAVINDMLERLGESHFSVVPAEIADTLNPADEGTTDGEVGIDSRLVDGAFLVTSVLAGSPADSAGVRPGWIIDSVGGQSTTRLLDRLRKMESRLPVELLAWRAVESRFEGTPGAAVEVAMRDGTDRPHHLRIVRRPAAAQPVKWGSFPTIFARATSRTLETPGGRPVGYVWFNNWVAPLLVRVDSAVDRNRGAAGMIMDLRGNTGGMGAMIMGVAGHFLNARVSIGTFQTRRNRLEFVANPRRVSPAGVPVTPFAGPVAILVDEGSASASEVFAGGMQAIGRARVFGRTSAGAVLGASWDRLPNGDVLYHAIANFITPNGVRLEGRGVIPDEPTPLTRAALLAGHDPALEAALRWIDLQATTNESR
jgi:carboxyl-terminal processing protease